jgi:hypothetical protein
MKKPEVENLVPLISALCVPVLPGLSKPSLHPKMTAILAPFTAVRTILLVKPHISPKFYSYNWKILLKVLIIRSCILIFLK